MNTGFIFTLIASFTVLYVAAITVLHDRKSVTNKFFALIGLSTIFWSFANYFSLEPFFFSTVVWARLVLFFAVPHITFFYFFVRNFPHDDLRLSKREIFGVGFIATCIATLTLTPYVFSGVHFTNGNAIPDPGLLIPAFAVFVVGLLVASIVQIVIKYSKAESTNKLSWRAMLMGFIVSYVLLITTNMLLVITREDTSFIVYGPLFMLPTVIGTAYSILRYRLLNVKAIATEVIVFFLLLITFIQIVLSQTTLEFILNGTIFVAFMVLSIFLVRSVLHEVEQREYLQMLNRELQDLIKQRENLVHLITHKVKGSFTRSKYIFAEMVAGSFGKLEGMMQKMAERGLESDNEGIHTVDLVLNAFNLGGGLVKYDMQPIELKKIVTQVLSEKGPRIKEKGLNVTLEAHDLEYPLVGDGFWIKEIVNNFIENALRYSVKGTIQVKLEKINDRIRLSVKDEGVGLSEDDKKGLFTEGGRGKESLKMNVDSTGYGLFSVKVIAEAHKGRVWAESDGRDKGSTFYVELPA